MIHLLVLLTLAAALAEETNPQEPILGQSFAPHHHQLQPHHTQNHNHGHQQQHHRSSLNHHIDLHQHQHQQQHLHHQQQQHLHHQQQQRSHHLPQHGQHHPLHHAQQHHMVGMGAPEGGEGEILGAPPPVFATTDVDHGFLQQMPPFPPGASAISDDVDVDHFGNQRVLGNQQGFLQQTPPFLLAGDVAQARLDGVFNQQQTAAVPRFSERSDADFGDQPSEDGRIDVSSPPSAMRPDFGFADQPLNGRQTFNGEQFFEGRPALIANDPNHQRTFFNQGNRGGLLNNRGILPSLQGNRGQLFPNRGGNVAGVQGFNQGQGFNRGQGFNQGQGFIQGQGFNRGLSPGQGFNQGQGFIQGQGFNQGPFFSNRGQTLIPNRGQAFIPGAATTFTSGFNQQGGGGAFFARQAQADRPVPSGRLLTSPYLFQFLEKRVSADERRRHLIVKRSLPILRLIHNPNVKLDFPKTIQNLGTAARNSLEDEKAPMHHMNNLIGSVKNTFLSALKIPPQGIVVPSRYRIVNAEELERPRIPSLAQRRQGQSPEDQPYDDIVITFQKVGTVLRDSIRSTQETFGHVGDVAHSARKIIHTSRFSSPRLVAPYAKAPAVQRPNYNGPRNHQPRGRLTLIAPKILGIARDTERDQPRDFVRAGEIMDALGVSDPSQRAFGLERIVVQPKFEVSPNVKVFARTHFDGNVAVDGEDRSRNLVLGDGEGVKRQGHLRELVGKIKAKNHDGGRSAARRAGKPQDLPRQATSSETDQEVHKLTTRVAPDETVGAGLPLSPNLMKPFMGRPSKKALTEFFRANGDAAADVDLDEEMVGDPAAFDNHVPDVDQILGAINPVMFEKFINESVTTSQHQNNATQAKELLQAMPGEKVRVSMDVDKNLLMPFVVDKQPPSKENVEDYLNYYNAKFKDGSGKKEGNKATAAAS